MAKTILLRIQPLNYGMRKEKDLMKLDERVRQKYNIWC